MVESCIGDDLAEYHLFLIVVSLKSHSHVSGYQRAPVCWGIGFLEGCSSSTLISSGDFGSSVFYHDFVVWNPHLLSPSSTQEFWYNSPTGHFLWELFCFFVFDSCSWFPWHFVSFWLLRYPVAILLKSCSWKITFFSFGVWESFNPFLRGRFYIIRGKPRI